MSLLTDLTSLIDMARSCLDLGDAEHEEFVLRVGKYMEAFESWHCSFENERQIGEEERVALKVPVGELGALHQDIIKRALSDRDSAGRELGQLHKKTKALRSYLDTLPSRISITGKREG